MRNKQQQDYRQQTGRMNLLYCQLHSVNPANTQFAAGG
jgi:hypothetical protein